MDGRLQPVTEVASWSMIVDQAMSRRSILSRQVGQQKRGRELYKYCHFLSKVLSYIATVYSLKLKKKHMHRVPRNLFKMLKYLKKSVKI